MTAKEKANKMCLDFLIDVHTDERDYGMNKEMAKQCALIAVDEILDVDYFDMSEEHFENIMEYWEQVKQEIQQL